MMVAIADQKAVDWAPVLPDIKNVPERIQPRLRVHAHLTHCAVLAGHQTLLGGQVWSGHFLMHLVGRPDRLPIALSPNMVASR